MTQSHSYRAPPCPLNRSGALRTVGLEVELGGLSLERALDVVHGAVGGTVALHSRTEGSVVQPAFGTFKVEFDHSMLRKRSYLRPLTRLGLVGTPDTADAVEDSVLRVASEIVPIEIVTPPLPWNRLRELDPLWDALRAAGAEDTHDSPLYAFGLHLNPESPDLDTGTLLAFMRAFLLLEDWLASASRVALTRRISPFIRPFPEEYRRLILQPEYAPTDQGFVDDYLTFSPTRNRPLDMAPLLMHVFGAGILARVEEAPLVKPRPTYHYRMPNSEIAAPGWTPARDWNRWLAVEALASQPTRLTELSRAYLATFDLPLRLQSQGWIETLESQLELPQ
ncbi:MAG TPA: amidoligase family protein [Polyangiales bacterium]